MHSSQRMRAEGCCWFRCCHDFTTSDVEQHDPSVAASSRLAPPVDNPGNVTLRVPSTAQTSVAASLEQISLDEIRAVVNGVETDRLSHLLPDRPSADLTNGTGRGSCEQLETSEHTITDAQSPRKQSFAVARAAALSGDVRTLRTVLPSTAEASWLANATDEFGRSLLVYAALADRYRVVDWLLRRRNAALHGADRHGKTALHWAIQRNAIKSCKVLLAMNDSSSRNSLVITSDSSGVTPLHLACRLPTTGCLKLLLSHLPPSEADRAKSYVDGHQRTVLHWAAVSGNSEHLEVLLQNEKLQLRNLSDARDVDGRTPLMCAVTATNADGGMSCCELLLALAPWSVSAQEDVGGLTALHLAVLSNNTAAASSLLSQCKDVRTVCDFELRSPLHYAAALGLKEFCYLLLQSDNEPRVGTALGDGTAAEGTVVGWWARDCLGAYPLHFAAAGDHVELLEMILRRNGFQDRSDKTRRRAFEWAVVSGRKRSLLRMLSLFNVDRTHRDINGRTALHLATEMDDEEVTKLLIEKGWSHKDTDLSGMTPLLLAASRGHLKVLQTLLHMGASWKAKDLQGRSVLHWTSLGGHTHICQTLLKQFGMDTNVSDQAGRTPLHCAAFAGHIGCVSALLQMGADAAAADNESRTALHMAADQGRVEIAELLVEWGSPVNAIALIHDRCLTPMDVSLLQENSELAESIVDQGGMTYSDVCQLAASMIQSYYRGYRVRCAMRRPTNVTRL